MNKTIQIVNCDTELIDIENSDFYSHTEFITMSDEGLLDLPQQEGQPSVVFLNLDETSENALAILKRLAPMMWETIFVALIPVEKLSIGIKALDYGASDFMITPCDSKTFGIYVQRAMDKICIHKDLLFKNEYYKSRYNLSEQKYQHLFNEVPCFIYTIDKEYMITDSNRKFNDYFGKQIGEYCFGICKNRDDRCRACPAKETFENGKGHVSESEIISSDGVKHTVLSWTAPLRNAAGNIHQVLVMLTDITEVRQLEDHLSSLGLMIGSISHGIKGLITSLDSGMYLMNSGYKKGDMERIEKGIEISNQVTEKIKKLVLNILYYSKTRQPAWQKVSADAFVDDLIQVITPAAEKKGIQLDVTMQCDTDDDYFEVDDKSLQSAFVNILENSMDACLATERTGNHKIMLNTRVKKDKILFIIKDNGIGMKERTLKNIFTIFYSSKGEKGTGLGLYITNKVIDQHSGEVKVRSTPGKGSNFLIKIPRRIPRTARNRATH